jgi:hypothetical protein
MTAPEPVQHVLAHSADAMASLDQFRKDYLNGHVASYLYQQVYESAKQLYGKTAVEHLTSQLGVTQIQHWRDKSVPEAVDALREAAGVTVPEDLEVAALRAEIRTIHDRLRAALGANYTVQGGVVVNEAVHAIERLNKLESR